MAEALRSILVLVEGAVGIGAAPSGAEGIEAATLERAVQESRTRKAERLLRERALRHRFLPAEILGEPAFDMLLDLFVQAGLGRDVSVSSLCLASRAPATTALRHLDAMEALKLVSRERDPKDRRRWFVRLTERANSDLTEWLDNI